ncbi:zinc finger protein 37-like [Hetaerina americana]|uniref:zinc finger protein 37-like n=1 Tax=Hetaerina americana TaxID=62018 RepID=UPI003A7F29EF
MKKDRKYFMKRCRLCGRCYDGAIDIFSIKEKNLPELINNCLNIKVREDDALPKKLCQFCDKKLMLWEKFKNLCENVQVKLIADSLPKKIEVTKNEKNGKANGTLEANSMVMNPSSFENIAKRKPICKTDDERNGNNVKATSETVLQQCDVVTAGTLNEDVEQDCKINLSSQSSYRSKLRGADQLISDIQNVCDPSKLSPEAALSGIIIKEDRKVKVSGITDQEIKDLYDTLSMNLKSEDTSDKMTTIEINKSDSCIDSGNEKVRNNLMAKKLRKRQQKESKLKNKKNKPLQEYCCQVCKEVFHSQKKLRSHVKSHSVQASEANTQKSPNVLRKFQCPNCPKRLTTAFNLHQHLGTHSEICNYCCHVCGKLFKTNSSLLNHLRVHVCDEMKESGKDSTILANGHSVKLYQCQVCDKKFRQSGHLAKHLKIHAGVRHFTCGECGMSFSEKYQLRRHVGGVHDKAKRYTCNVCGKQFLHSHNFKNHALQHDGVAGVSCDVCGKTFLTSQAMNRHRRLHTGEKPFLCDICGKAFRDCSNRKRHRNKHIKKAEETLAAKKPSPEESSSPLDIIDAAMESNEKSEVDRGKMAKSESVQESEISERVVFDGTRKDQEEGKAKKAYLDLKTYFESNDVVSLKDEVEDEENVESPLDIIPLNGNHNISILQQIHVAGKFDESSNSGPLFGGGLFGEELDLNPESLLLIGDGRINNSLMEGTESDGEVIKDQLVWVPSNGIQSDTALSGIHCGDVALNGIQSGDICLNGIQQGDIGLNSMQTGDVSGILETGMGLCGEFDVNSAMELDSEKDELPGDFPSISEIKAVEESDKSSDNVLRLQVCILV